MLQSARVLIYYACSYVLSHRHLEYWKCWFSGLCVPKLIEFIAITYCSRKRHKAVSTQLYIKD